MSFTDNKHFGSGTYLHSKRYLALNDKCRFIRKFPDTGPNHFAKTRYEVVGNELLLCREYNEMLKIENDWWGKEIARLKALGYNAQIDLIENRQHKYSSS